jgi:hypothetical protein
MKRRAKKAIEWSLFTEECVNRYLHQLDSNDRQDDR